MDSDNKWYGYLTEYRVWPILTMIGYLSFVRISWPVRYIGASVAVISACMVVKGAIREFAAFRSFGSVKYMIYVMVIAYFAYFFVNFWKIV